MKCEFWLTLVPKYDGKGNVRRVVADRITQTRPRRGNGVAIKVSLDVSPALFDPLRVEGTFDGETETVVLQSEPIDG